MAGGNEIATAYLAIVPTMSGVKKAIEEALADVDAKGAGERTGREASSGFASAFKSAAATVAKAAAAGVAAMGTAAVAVGKSALESYAQYEQLVGGVDKLFGDASGKLQEYAAKAYKTSGMSANQYMEQATSFSASLISSLGGDTAQAAELANVAMVAMADNVNVFGSNMEDVQNAFQGFAKQNYTMLDNLKLGYGGTQEEMKRLVSDAAALTDVQKQLGLTVDENSLSFDNIVKAIQVMQTEMGIAGTTTNEAATTIEGSVNMAKAAWDNWLTGLADDSADMEELTNQLVDSVATAASNIVPRIGEIMESLPPAVLEALDELYEDIMASFEENGVEIGEAALDAFLNILAALEDVAKKVLVALGLLLASILVAIGNKVGEFYDKGVAVIKGMWDGVKDKFGELKEWVAGIPSRLRAALGDVGSYLYNAGSQLIQGFVDGVKDMAGSLISAVTGPINDAISGAKRLLGIASPSKVFRQIGDYAMQGLELGISGGASGAVGAMDSAVRDVMGAAAVTVPPSSWGATGATGAASSGGAAGGATYNVSVTFDIDRLDDLLSHAGSIEELVAWVNRARLMYPTRA